MEFIFYNKCSTCQKAKDYLDKHHIPYKERSIINENPSYEEIKNWVTKFAFDINKLFNTSGLKYKELGLKDKLKQMGEEEKIRLLATNGKLLRRPIIVFLNGEKEDYLSSSGFLYGFKEKEWDLFFSKLR